MGIQHDALVAFRDHWGDLLDMDDRLTDEGRDNLDPHWQDQLSEIADDLVPVYTTDRVREWLDDGCRDIDDYGLIDGLSDVVQIIAVVLYERYSNELSWLANEAGFND